MNLKLNFYLTILIGFKSLSLLEAVDNECDQTVMIDLINAMRDNHRKLRLMFGQLDSFFERLQGDFCDADSKCPDVYESETVEKSHQRLPTSCAEALQEDDPDGVRKLQIPDIDYPAFYAFCMHDPDQNGSAWTVLVNRIGDSIDFNRNFNDYKYGFGDISYEHWIGLEPIHAMTYFQPHELWIHLQSEVREENVHFTLFAINCAYYGYEFNVLGERFGTDLREDLRYVVGNRFSTSDMDFSKHNCAKKHESGWWFYEAPTKFESYCTEVLLTGSNNHSVHKGLSYNHFNERYGQIEIAFMAIRPIKKQ